MQNDNEYPKEIVNWVENNIIIVPGHFIGEEVIPAESVLDKLAELVAESEEKAEILFEIVKPQTDKTLREITKEELKELTINFKDGL